MTSVKIYAILLLFSAISSFNLGLFYMIQSIKNNSKIFMAIGTVVFSICLLFALYELTDLTTKYPHLMWINGPLLFAIGPLFYIHVKRKATWREVFHFVPLVIIFIWILPFYLKSSSEKLEIIKGFYAPLEKPEIEIMQYLYVLHIGIYCFFGYRILRKKSVLFDSYDSNDTQNRLNIRSQNLYLLISVLGVLSFFVCFISDVFGVYYGTVDRFTFSLLVILVLLLQIYFSFKGYDENLEVELENIKDKKVNHNPSITDEFRHISKKLDQLMIEEKLYQNPNLKISDVAEKMDISMHKLSAAINQENGNNFFDYVNKLRVSELKQTLLDDDRKNFTLFAIANESGFKSNSSFYRVFKKYVGCTPKRYIKQNEK